MKLFTRQWNPRVYKAKEISCTLVYILLFLFSDCGCCMTSYFVVLLLPWFPEMMALTLNSGSNNPFSFSALLSEPIITAKRMYTLLQRHWRFCFFKQMHVAWQPCTWSSLALVVMRTVSATSSHTFLLSDRQESTWWLSETKYICSCFSFSVTCSSEYQDNFLCNSHNPTMDGWNGLKEGCLYTKQPFHEGPQSLVLT